VSLNEAVSLPNGLFQRRRGLPALLDPMAEGLPVVVPLEEVPLGRQVVDQFGGVDDVSVVGGDHLSPTPSMGLRVLLGGGAEGGPSELHHPPDSLHL